MALAAYDDFPSSQAFLNRQPSKCLKSPADSDGLKSTNIRRSDFCNYIYDIILVITMCERENNGAWESREAFLLAFLRNRDYSDFSSFLLSYSVNITYLHNPACPSTTSLLQIVSARPEGVSFCNCIGHFTKVDFVPLDSVVGPDSTSNFMLFI